MGLRELLTSAFSTAQEKIAAAAKAVQALAVETEDAAPKVQTLAKATAAVGFAIDNEFIGPMQAEQLLVTRSIQDTAKLTRHMEEWARVNGAVLPSRRP